MALNTTQTEIDDAADRDTKKKIEQEAIITSVILRRYFKPLSREAFVHYAEFGAFPNLDAHTIELGKILNSRYSDTASKFIKQIRDELGRPENAAELNSLINDASGIQQAMDIFFSQPSIHDTTKKDLNKTVTSIIVAAAAIGVRLSNKEIAKQAKPKFDDLSESRLPTISMTETQGAAEGAKYNEANTLQKNNAVFVAAGVALVRDKMTKTWVTKMDKRVRAAHVKAEGQKRPFGVPYLVMGELLKRPKDTSLGASLKNVINCRCSSVVTIRRRGVTRTFVDTTPDSPNLS